MPALAHRSPDNPDFARVVAVRGLKRNSNFAFDIAPDAAEAAALARLLDARAVRKMRFVGALSPEGDGWTLRGRLGATVVQSCVVTLEPVSTRVDVDVRRVFRPIDDAGGRQIAIAPDEDDDVEPLAERLDLGLIAIEAIALALPAYPRAQDAELGDDGFASGGQSSGEDTVKPFAALAQLRAGRDRQK